MSMDSSGSNLFMEPGQFSVRGSIVDIFSFSNEDPYRIDFFGDEVDSIRSFDIDSQISKLPFPNNYDYSRTFSRSPK